MLVRESISTKVDIVAFHPHSRVIAITIAYNNLRVLCFGVYLPFDDDSSAYNDRLGDIFGFTKITAEMYPSFKCIILSDFNLECFTSKRGYCAFTPFMKDLNLCVCDHMDYNNAGYTLLNCFASAVFM